MNWRLLKPRRPKSQREWATKIIAAFAIGLLMFVLSPRSDTGGAVGLYYRENDTIWISEDLDNDAREIVTAHEEAHRAFYRTLPFWTSVKYAAAVLMFPLLILSLLIFEKRAWYAVAVLSLVLATTEIHAYGATLLQFGPNTYTYPNLIGCASLPLSIALAGWWVFKPRPKTEKPKFVKFRRYVGSERKKVGRYLIAVRLLLVATGVVLGYYLFSGNPLVLLPLAAIALAMRQLKRRLDRMKAVVAKGLEQKRSRR